MATKSSPLVKKFTQAKIILRIREFLQGFPPMDSHDYAFEMSRRYPTVSEMRGDYPLDDIPLDQPAYHKRDYRNIDRIAQSVDNIELLSSGEGLKDLEKTPESSWAKRSAGRALSWDPPSFWKTRLGGD
ncbi:hypothetical protein ACOME3_006905 [Neoechinorhynchus agilis]